MKTLYAAKGAYYVIENSTGRFFIELFREQNNEATNIQAIENKHYLSGTSQFFVVYATFNLDYSGKIRALDQSQILLLTYFTE